MRPGSARLWATGVSTGGEHVYRFDSNALAPGKRFEAWLALHDRHLEKLRMEPAADRPFTAEIGVQPMDGVSLVLSTGCGFRMARTRSEIARTSTHFYTACVHLDGAARVRSLGGERALNTGDVFLLDSMHEFELGLEQPFRHLLIKVPKRWIDARIARPDLLAGAVLPCDNPLARLFANYLAAGFETADRLSASARAMTTQHLLDLLAEAFTGLHASDPLSSQARRAALFAWACRLIALRFSEPDLRPENIACGVGVSTRMLHKIFAGHDETVMKVVLAERVERAAKLLAQPAGRERTITEIAYACGFNDASHFGRVFEARMGATPSQWRREVR
jgi:AraC family transcriptional regulator, positive regulator of tynA and feaB